MSPMISIVIPTHRRRASVERALRALSSQSLPPEQYEVIVSVDGEGEGTREMTERFRAPFSLRSLTREKRGRAAACNAGLREARGEIALLLDDDMEPEPACLAAHRAAHRGKTRLGLLAAVPVVLEPDTAPVVRYVGEKFNRHLEKLARPGQVVEIRDFYTGHFSIRRDLLLQLGGFDEDFALYGNEDVELAVRLQKAGVELLYSAEAVARQHYEKDFAALARDNVEKGRTAVLCARKHPEAFERLKLSRFGEGSGKWRALRGLLLALGRVAPATPHRVARFVGWLERWRPENLSGYYALALDYFYWVGARAALAEGPLGQFASPLSSIEHETQRRLLHR